MIQRASFPMIDPEEGVFKFKPVSDEFKISKNFTGEILPASGSEIIFEILIISSELSANKEGVISAIQKMIRKSIILDSDRFEIPDSILCSSKFITPEMKKAYLEKMEDAKINNKRLYDLLRSNHIYYDDVEVKLEFKGRIYIPSGVKVIEI